MTWNVELTETFTDWYQELDDLDRYKILAGIKLIKAKGPTLGRPHVDTVYGSKLSNLKELIVQCKKTPYRIFFIFDSERSAIMLCGGRKDGSKDKRFYQDMIKMAETIYKNIKESA